MNKKDLIRVIRKVVQEEVKKEDIYSNIDEMLKSTLDTKNE